MGVRGGSGNKNRNNNSSNNNVDDDENRNNNTGRGEVINSALSGSIAAIISGFVSCPLDVIKTRLMTQDVKIKINGN